MPSEAYGIIHSIKSLYSEEIAKPVFIPKIYDGSLDINKNLINESQKYSMNQKKFSEYVEESDLFNNLNQAVKLVLNNETKKNLNYIDSNLRNNDQIKPVKKEKFICSIENKPVNLTNGNFSQKWVNPPKIIFKPFVKAIIKAKNI